MTENTYENEMGKWVITEGGTYMLIDSSQDWLDKRKPTDEPTAEPTLEEKLVALEQENLTLKEAQAETNTTLLEFMEAVLIGGM